MTATINQRTIYEATCEPCDMYIVSGNKANVENDVAKHNLKYHGHCEATVNISGNTYRCAHGRQHKGKHVFENDEMYVVW